MRGREREGGAYKPSEFASCSSSARTWRWYVSSAALLSCASFCARSAFFLSRSCACANRMRRSISARSSAMSACTRSANASTLKVPARSTTGERGEPGVPAPELGIAAEALPPLPFPLVLPLPGV